MGRPITFCRCGFFLIRSLFASPILSSRILDVYHTSTHDVALVRIQNAGLKCDARGSLNIQDAKIRHLRTIAQLYRAISLQLRRLSTIGKKLGKQSYLLHKASHNVVNVGSQLRSVGECGARQ